MKPSLSACQPSMARTNSSNTDFFSAVSYPLSDNDDPSHRATHPQTTTESESDDLSHRATHLQIVNESKVSRPSNPVSTSQGASQAPISMLNDTNNIPRKIITSALVQASQCQHASQLQLCRLCIMDKPWLFSGANLPYLPMDNRTKHMTPYSDSLLAALSYTGLPNNLVEALGLMKVNGSKLIQGGCLQVILGNRDLRASAPPGNTRTLAYLIPITMRLLSSPLVPPRFVRALILCPTRLLAIQTFKIAVQVCHQTHIRPALLCGGCPMKGQVEELGQGCEILIVTPGRLLHTLQRGILDCSKLMHIVLDEATAFSRPRLEQELTDILTQYIPYDTTANCSMLLFATSYTNAQNNLVNRYLRPEGYDTIENTRDLGSSSSIQHEVRFCKRQDRYKQLVTDLNNICLNGPRQTIIFVESRREAEYLNGLLYNDGYQVDTLHYDRTDQAREAVTNRFKEGELAILIATDGVVCGLRFDHCTQVIQFHLPRYIEVFVERAWRADNGSGATGHNLFYYDRGHARDVALGPELTKLFLTPTE